MEFYGEQQQQKVQNQKARKECQKKKNFDTFISNRKVDPAAMPLMKDVGTTMGVRLEERDTNRRGSEYVYTEKDVEEMIARMK